MVAKHNEATKYEHNGSTEQVVLKDVNSDYLFVKSDYKLVRIDFSDILYIEGLKDYVKIYISSEPKPILCLSSMRSFENALPSDTFYRIHRSYIVNMQKVRVFEKDKSWSMANTYLFRIAIRSKFRRILISICCKGVDSL